MKITTTLFLIFFIVINAVAQMSSDLNPKTNEAQVIAVHQLELKPEVKEKDFEHLIIDKLLPLYDKIDGQKAFLMKGDRGNRTGKYAIFLTFESVEVRDRIYPAKGGISEDFEKVLEGSDPIWDQLNSYVVGDVFGNHTDYLRVINKE